MKIEKVHIDHIKYLSENIQSKKDILNLLNFSNTLLYGNDVKKIKLNALNYYADPNKCISRYTSFKIKKKSGEERIIHAPVPGLKAILRSLNVILQIVYETHPATFGFIVDKSIVDNAKKHVNHSFVFNIDLQDFFHSFDRNKVKLAFMNLPFNLNGKEKEPLAFLLASLCTHPFEINGESKTVLPQGSPTSPTLTNILCYKLDHRLQGFAKRFKVVYSRYADDITFSSNINIFDTEEFKNELKRIIEENQGLKIKTNKTRLQKSAFKQEVTGLIVNEKVNVRKKYIKQIRMWLYYWEKYGYEKAELLFRKDYVTDKGHVKNNNAHLVNVLDGKLEYLKMVKGTDDSTYKILRERYDNLVFFDKSIPKENMNIILNTLFSEGLNKAMKLYNNYQKRRHEG